MSYSDKDGWAETLPSVWRVNRTVDGWIPPSRVSIREKCLCQKTGGGGQLVFCVFFFTFAFAHCVLTHFYVLVRLPVILQECGYVRNACAERGFFLEVEVSPVAPQGLCLWRSSDLHSSHHASGERCSSHKEMCRFDGKCTKSGNCKPKAAILWCLRLMSC